MTTHAIELTDTEKALLDTIKLEALDLDGADDAHRNAAAVCTLMKSLISRRAIPQVRAAYFLDPDHNIGGRGKSRKETFERNGVYGDDIYRHPHFLPYLKYFLFGPNLPASLIAGFYREVSACGSVTSSDIIPLGKYARRQTRAYSLNSSQAAEEFYKLSLDCGLSYSYASSIRNSVKQAR